MPPSFKKQGSIGLSPGSGRNGRIADAMARSPGPIGRGSIALTPEQEELALDLSQMVLDIIGAFEVPAADGANALISLGRRDWLGATLSSLSMIPILGEVAKAGKIGKWVRTVNESIRVARTDSRFAALLRPALRNVRKLLAHIPTSGIPGRIGHEIEEMKTAIDAFLGTTGLNRIVADLLIARFGSIEHVGTLVRENVEIAVEYFETRGMKVEQMKVALSGIDLHAAERLEVVSFKKGDRVAQYVDTLKKEGKQTGEWFVKEQGAVSHRNLGISAGIPQGKAMSEATRQRRIFEVTEDVPVLKSRAAYVNDTWTKAVKYGWTGASKVRGKNAEMTSGGGTQYFLPEAYKYLKEAK